MRILLDVEILYETVRQVPGERLSEQCNVDYEANDFTTTRQCHSEFNMVNRIGTKHKHTQLLNAIYATRDTCSHMAYQRLLRQDTSEFTGTSRKKI